MRLMVALMGLVLVVGAELTLPADAQTAADPARRPQYQRTLTAKETAEAAALRKEMNRLFNMGMFQEALTEADKELALRTRVQGADHWQTANAAWYVESMRRLLKASPQIQHDVRTLDKVIREAEQQEGRGNFAAAGPLREQILKTWLAAYGPEHPYPLTALTNLASNLAARQRYGEAEVKARQALARSREVLGEKHVDTAARYNMLAMILKAQGKYGTAEEQYKLSLAILLEAVGPEDLRVASCYSNFGNCLHSQGRYTEADGFFRQALLLDLKRHGEVHRYTLISSLNFAANLISQGRFAEAERITERAVSLAQQLHGEDSLQVATAWNLHGTGLLRQEREAEAELYFRKALAFRQRLLGEHDLHTINTLSNLGQALQRLGRSAEAEHCLQQALTSVRQGPLGNEHPLRGVVQHNLATALDRQGRYAEAERHFRDSLELNRKLGGDSHPHTIESSRCLATCCYFQGKYVEAIQVLTVAGEAFAKARLQLSSAGTAQLRSDHLSPWELLGLLLAKRGRPAEAWQRFEDSLARGTLDELSARLQHTPAERTRLSDLAGEVQQLDTVLGRMSAAALSADQAKRRDELLLRRQQKQEELGTFLKGLEAKYPAAAGQPLQLEAVQALLPADTALVSWVDCWYRDSGEKHSKSDHWAVIVRSRGDPVWVHLEGSGPGGVWTVADFQLADKLRRGLLRGDNAWEKLAQQLHTQRVSPLAPHLKDIKRLVVVSSPVLNGLPVELFAEGFTVSYVPSASLYAHLRQRPPSGARRALALESPSFRPQAQAAPVMDKPGTPLRPEVLLAGQLRGERAWAELPGTRFEAGVLRRLLGEANVTVLAGSDASEQQLAELARTKQLSEHRFLHLATHGEANHRVPFQSALILAQDRVPDLYQQMEAGLPAFDGRLTALEVLRGWTLDADLVTLSACQTALGQFQRREGFLGFAQALLLAGARCVCLSLWKVDDTATALLMQRFYQNLLGQRPELKQPLTKAAALAEAKTWLRGLSRTEASQLVASLEKSEARGTGRPTLPPLPRAEGDSEARPFAHPYYWAAFVLIGAAD